jgi:hypothetical protein
MPPDGVVVRSDAEARRVLEEARRQGRPFPTLGLAGGDLCRTLGGRGDPARLHLADAARFAVDVGEVLLDGRLHLFVAHLVARDPLWLRAFVAMNAEWLGRLDLGPRAHPGDGLLDTYEARLRPGDLPAVWRRARTGTHLPHPRIRERRAPAVQVGFPRPRWVWLDGERVGRARNLAVRVAPAAAVVVV